MFNKALSHKNFSLTEARYIVKDQFTPNPVIYWADFTLSLACGIVSFVLVRRVLTPLSVQQALMFVFCGLCFYRAVLFSHELVHLRAGTFAVFRVMWNLTCGIPFLMPSFMYYTHVDHHMRKHFATRQDGEYMPFGTWAPWHILIYLCQPFVIPAIAVVRFLMLAPLSWISPKFRDFVHRHASSMVMDPRYIRPLPTRKALRIFRLQETLCFLWVVGVAAVLSLRIIPIGFLTTAYLLSVFILFMNAVRTLGAHRYTNGQRGEISFVDQMLDSVNYPRHPWIAELWAPVGLRYHALHHLFPSLPFHNLHKAHELLMAGLPADSPYRLTESPSLTASLVQLWRAARAAARKDAVNRQASHPSRLTGGRRLQAH